MKAAAMKPEGLKCAIGSLARFKERPQANELANTWARPEAQGRPGALKSHPPTAWAGGQGRRDQQASQQRGPR